MPKTSKIRFNGKVFKQTVRGSKNQYIRKTKKGFQTLHFKKNKREAINLANAENRYSKSKGRKVYRTTYKSYPYAILSPIIKNKRRQIK